MLAAGKKNHFTKTLQLYENLYISFETGFLRGHARSGKSQFCWVARGGRDIQSGRGCLEAERQKSVDISRLRCRDSFGWEPMQLLECVIARKSWGEEAAFRITVKSAAEPDIFVWPE
jgi:hypothetical protein